MCYKCYICNLDLNLDNLLHIPTNENYINKSNLQYFKKIYNLNTKQITIKNIDNFIFFYYNLCLTCFDDYINIKNCNNIIKKIKNRELGIKY